MDLILKCKSELKNLSKANTIKKRKLILKSFDNCVITAIAEISSNCLSGNVPLSTCNYKKLRKYKTILRQLAKKNISISKKKNIIIQKGGFLNILIPAAISLLTTVIERQFKK